MFLFQVLYLDNLNFGPSTPVVLELPRGSIFNGSYLAHLINLDQRKNSGEQVPEYGLHKVQILKSVHNGELFYIGKNCHSVAEWRSFFSFMWYLHEVLTFVCLCIALPNDVHAIAVGNASWYFANPRTTCCSPGPSLRKLSAVTSSDIVQTYKDWYPEYTAVFTPILQGTG